MAAKIELTPALDGHKQQSLEACPFLGAVSRYFQRIDTIPAIRFKIQQRPKNQANRGFWRLVVGLKLN